MKKCAAALLFFFGLRPPQHQLFADVLHQFGAGGGTEGFGDGDALLPVVASHLHFDQFAGGEAGVGLFDHSLGEPLFADEHGGAQLMGLLFEAADIFVAECCNFID